MLYGTFGFIDFLCAMPDGNNPDRLFLHTIEKTVRTDDHFPMRHVGKLRNGTAGLRMVLEASQNPFCAFSKPPSSERFVLPDVF